MKTVSVEDLKQIQEFRQNLIQIITSIGELHLNKMMLTTQINQISSQIQDEEKKFSKFQEDEKILYEKLQEKYGSGNINLETGEITE